MPKRGMNRRTNPEGVAFGNALVRLRGRTGWKQYEVAAKAELTKAMVSSYETGKTYPTLPTLLAYLRAVGADFCDLQKSIDAGLQDMHLRKDHPESVEREVGRAVLALVDKIRQSERTRLEGDEDDDA